MWVNTVGASFRTSGAAGENSACQEQKDILGDSVKKKGKLRNEMRCNSL